MAAAVDRDIGSFYPVLSLLASSEFCTAICVRAGIVRVSVGLLGLYRSFFIIGGMDCTFLRLRDVLPFSIVGITADREMVPISLDASPFHQLCRVQEYRKKCVRAVKTSRKWVSHTG